MSHPPRLSKADLKDELRLNAQTLLRNGSAPSPGLGSLGVEALELLYRRASDPEFAADAVKLLHELQTHQVELDLVYEQMQSTENELTEALAHYTALYDMAPTPYLILDADGLIVESNQAAKDLLGLSVASLTQQSLGGFLAAPGRAAVETMFQDLQTSQSEQSCVAELSRELGECRRLAIKAKAGAGGNRILCVLSAAPPVAEP
jgi:PAS domain S-box-containing protein